MAEIGEIKFTMFIIKGRKNYLADQGSRNPTGGAGNDRGDGVAGKGDSAKRTGAASAEIRANTAGSWPTMDLPTDDCYPNIAQIFAYGAATPYEDAEVGDDECLDSKDYMGQCLLETAAYLSISAGRRVSVAMTVNRLKEEIKSDVFLQIYQTSFRWYNEYC